MRILLPESIIPVYLKATQANRPFMTEEGAHQRIGERFLRPASYGPPSGVKGVRVNRRLPDPKGWPVYDVEPSTPAAQAARPEAVVVYVHGGGWVNEIAPQHWKLIARIARETNQRVIVPIYPLLPFGTARGVRDGVIELIRAELDSGHQVRLAGDSAGGQISLSAALQLRDEGVQLPATTLLSPALDLTWRNPQIDVVQPLDPWLGRPGGRALSQEWQGDDELDDPLVSPLFGDMSGLGPLTIVTGTRDVLNPDAHLLRDKAEEAGVPVAWSEGEGQLHVYALLPTKAGDEGASTMVDSLRPTT